MQKFTVRAMPAQGHTVRRRIGRAWGKAPVVVVVVDKPEAGEKGVDQITPQQLARLQADPHLAVAAVGEVNADVHALNDAKARIVELERELTSARGDVAQLFEERKEMRSAFEEQVRNSGARVAELEAEVHQLRAQIGAKKRKDA